jgi:hypothetical protein
MRVFYNINGTVKVSDRILEIWSECRLVELYFSIDDINERFEYQRTGANWNELINNLNWYINNMPTNHLFYINCTWGYLNLYYLDELVNWQQSRFGANRLGDNVKIIFQKAIGDCAINHVSAKLKSKLIEKFKNYPILLELVNSLEERDADHSKFLEYINKLDEIRGSSFNRLCPEFATLLS